jgi:hypothetical protein
MSSDSAKELWMPEREMQRTETAHRNSSNST